MSRCLILLLICVATLPVQGAVDPVTTGRWNLDAQETVRENYPTMKAANAGTPDLDVLLKASASANTIDSVIIDQTKIDVLIADLRTSYLIVDSWQDDANRVRYIKTKASNAPGDDSLRYFVFGMTGDVLRWHDLRQGWRLSKIYRRDAGSGTAPNIEPFISKTLFEMESTYQGGAYDDPDGNGIGSYCFNADLLFGAVMGDPHAMAFLKDLKPDQRRKAEMEYKVIVNGGWKVTIVPGGTDANAREKSYKVIVSKGTIAYIGVPGKAVELRKDYDGK